MLYDQLERDFLTRTLELLKQYDTLLPALPDRSQFEQTLLMNCLVGLLLLPKERWKTQMDTFANDTLDKWEVPACTVTSWGASNDSHKPSGQTFGQFIRHLRNAVAHMRVEARGDADKIICEWQFTDENGFEAVLATDALRALVDRIAARLLAT